MASAKEKTGTDSNVITREQLLKEEEMLAKAQAYAKLLRSWERGKAMALELAKQEDRCLERARKREQAEVKEELYHANKQLKMVRRAALRHRLSFEHLQYQLELNHLGKSFFTERL
ncbi:cilia- and flagella-associated protein 141 [Podarcis muralis]|uniref:uncharacterized protein C1orf189 homolog n=1 Tax=Podarcis muralis TaxID=64176 RepID=UPI00109F339E|nr:uncharacterized protein C1orf189 homolog [Podarcis muralis]XP_053215789.1 cilia- and flagella-associated protein 141 [Podarcis raffonei]